MSVLVAHKTEKFVLDDWEGECSPCRVAVQLGHFFVAGDVGILVVEEGSGIQPVRSAMPVSLAVDGIGSRRGTHVNVRAAGRALLRIVHRGVYAKFLNRLG